MIKTDFCHQIWIHCHLLDFPAILAFATVGAWIHRLTTDSSNHLLDFPAISVPAVFGAWVHQLTTAVPAKLPDYSDMIQAPVQLQTLLLWHFGGT